MQSPDTEISLMVPRIFPFRMLMNIAYSFLIQLFVNEFETNQLMVCMLCPCSWQEKTASCWQARR